MKLFWTIWMIAFAQDIFEQKVMGYCRVNTILTEISGNISSDVVNDYNDCTWTLPGSVNESSALVIILTTSAKYWNVDRYSNWEMIYIPGKSTYHLTSADFPYCAIYTTRDSYCTPRYIKPQATNMATICKDFQLIFSNQSSPTIRIDVYRKRLLHKQDYVKYKFIPCHHKEGLLTTTDGDEGNSSILSSIHFIVIIIALLIALIIFLALFLRQRRLLVAKIKEEETTKVHFSTRQNNVPVNVGSDNQMTESNPQIDDSYSVIGRKETDKRQLVNDAVYEGVQSPDYEESGANIPPPVYAVVNKT